MLEIRKGILDEIQTNLDIQANPRSATHLEIMTFYIALRIRFVKVLGACSWNFASGAFDYTGFLLSFEFIKKTSFEKSAILWKNRQLKPDESPIKIQSWAPMRFHVMHPAQVRLPKQALPGSTLDHPMRAGTSKQRNLWPQRLLAVIEPNKGCEGITDSAPNRTSLLEQASALPARKSVDRTLWTLRL